MRFRERTISRPSMIVAAAGLVAGALCAVYVTPMALNSENRSSSVKRDPSAVASSVAKKLGTRSTGAYVEAGKLIVPVTTAADARTVRAAGGVPKMVTRSGVDLANATTVLRKSTSEISGTGWAKDPRTNQMVVWADESVRGAKLASVRETISELGGAARIERIPGKLQLTATAAAGDAIFGGGSRCSLGFNVRQGNAFGFITAGHCGNAVEEWTADEQGQEVLGNTLQSSFPGNDFAIVQYATAGEEPPGTVNLGNGQQQDITGAREAVVGETVQRMGSTTGLNDGEVQQLDATVNFPEGTVTGMIRTNVCAEPGDSGGPLFAGGDALGLTSGGNGDCQAGGTTFFQPITEALETFNVEVF